MTSRTHPFDLIKQAVRLHANSFAVFQRFRTGIESDELKDFMPWIVSKVAADEHTFEATLAGVTLLCALTVDSSKPKPGIVSVYRVSRIGDDAPVPLGTVEFDARTGYTDLRHFSEYAEDEGDRLELNSPYGAKTMLATFLLKELGHVG